jgi:mercuric ion transport protein
MKPQRLGILSSVVASVCCLGPPLLILLGLGSLGVGAFLGKYHWYFILGGGVLLTVAWISYFKEKRRCQTHQCQMARQGTTRGILVAATLIVAVFAGLNAYTYLAPQDQP